MKPPPPVSAALWQQRYETLRQHVVQGSQILGSDPLGLVVLFTRGLAGWMHRWWEAPAESPTIFAGAGIALRSSSSTVAGCV